MFHVVEVSFKIPDIEHSVLGDIFIHLEFLFLS